MDRAPTFLADPPTTPPAQEAYDADLAADGYVNNLTRLWCWRPDVLSAFQELRAGLVAGSALTPRDVAVMVVAAAAARSDSYCALAWGTRLAEDAGEAAAVAVLRGEDGDLPERDAALARWTRQVVRDPHATTPADVDRLRRAGLGDREIFEATAWVALRLAFSTVNDALGALPDPELAERAPRAVRDAVSFGRPVARDVPPVT